MSVRVAASGCPGHIEFMLVIETAGNDTPRACRIHMLRIQRGATFNFDRLLTLKIDMRRPPPVYMRRLTLPAVV